MTPGQELVGYTRDQAHPATDWESLPAHRWLIRVLMAMLRLALVKV